MITAIKHDIDEEYGDIRAIYRHEPNGPYVVQIFYQGQQIYIFETARAYEDKILEITQSLSPEKKCEYFQIFVNSVHVFWEGFDTHNTDSEGRADGRNVILAAFTTIGTVLKDDYDKSKSNITFQNGQMQEKKDIKLENPDGISKKFEHTLAMLMVNGSITREEKDGGHEYWLSRSLKETIEALEAMKKSGKIEIPYGEEGIDSFIKRYIRTKEGECIEGNLRTYWSKRRASEKGEPV